MVLNGHSDGASSRLSLWYVSGVKKLVSSCCFFPFLQSVSWHQLKETAHCGEFQFCVLFLHYSLVACVSLSFMCLTHKTTITDHARCWRQLITLFMACLASVRVQPCISNSMLFQCISDASPKLLCVLWHIAHQTLHATQLCTAPCICTFTHAASACLFVCLPLSLAHVLFVCLFPLLDCLH